MKKLFLLSCLALFGCAKHANVANYAGTDFSHTSSMCLDALLVNMNKDQCLSNSMEIAAGVMIVKCENKPADLESFWTDHTFFIIPTTAQAEIVNGVMICLDFNFGMFVALQPSNQLEENQSNE